MKKFIFLLSLIFSLHGILAALYFIFFNFEGLSELRYNLLFNVQPYNFRGLGIEYLLEETPTSSRSINLGLLNLFLYLTFFTSTLLYIVSKYKETRLLIFNYCLTIVYALMILTSISLYLVTGKAASFYLYFNLAMIVFHVTVSIFFISKLNYKELNTYTEKKGGEDLVYLDNASKGKRFLNMIIDNIIVIMIAYWFIEAAGSNENIGNFLRKFDSLFGEKFSGFFFFMLVKFIYYILFESLFQATPGKFLTNTSVTDEEGNKIRFPNLLKRTLFRFIPLESISFLMGSNLHDAYSFSYVINKKHSSKNTNLYLIFMSIGLLIALLIYFYKMIKNI